MKKKCLIFVSALIIYTTSSIAQTTADYAVQIDVTVQEIPPQITLNWVNDTVAISYQVYRKSLQDTAWGVAIDSLAGTAAQYIDNAVQADTAYEYKIYKVAPSYVTAYGYVYAGIKKPAIHYNGRILVLVDSFFVDSVAIELFRFEKDLASDGWDVTINYFSRTDSVSSVKNFIAGEYNTSSNNVKAVMLVGHVPVPYSGDLNPDGHPDHEGAWPADVYYGDMNGVWTDITINNTVASRPENRNIPGDGKFDQTHIPSDVDLQVSRIDFYNMPSSGKTEFQLMKNYLNRDHAFRKKEIVLNERGLIDDNFGPFYQEAFAANGFKNFAPLVGKSNILETDFMTTLGTNDYLWAYGCGGGSYTGASGIGTSSQMMNQDVNAVFTMLFGSYFGDWDSQDNFLRSPLCANIPALTCAWAGRPHWNFHTMGLGLNIGYGTRTSQNNSALYPTIYYGGRFVHVALMGDLTLKQNVLAPPQSVSIASTTSGFGKIINWNSSADTVLGYYVYRSDTELEGYELISNLIIGNSFTDSIGTDGMKHYLVRALRLETTPSGSYYNLSEGEGDSANVVYDNVGVNEIKIADLGFKVYPNPGTNQITIEIYDKAAIEILNIEGQIMKTISTAEKQNSIDVSDLSKGIYIIKAKTDRGVAVKKFIKE